MDEIGHYKGMMAETEKVYQRMNRTNASNDIHNDDFAPYFSLITFAVLAIIINSIVFFVGIRNKKIRRRTSNKFVLNLSLSNVCVASVVLSLSVSVVVLNTSEHAFNEHNEPAPEMSLMHGVLILLSVINMMLLSADRLYAVKWTFSYFAVSNSKKVGCIFCVGVEGDETSGIVLWYLRYY